MEISCTSFWVGVYCSADSSYAVDFASNISIMLKRHEGNEVLLYLRYFNNLQDAIGHKLFLESLSVTSLRTNIRTQNPKVKDLRNMVAQYLAMT
jgi:hypothetical protein